jgi:prolipoprotein diacylglyceryltransferase
VIELFVLALAVVLAAGLAFGFRTLPRERWQVLATLPLRKESDGAWRGLNLTWYGLLSANAYAAALLAVFFLLGSIRVPHPVTATMMAILLAVVVPASRLVARVVEKKKHTFTVGGATFAGILAFPVAILATEWATGTTVRVLPVAAATGVGYALGEGLGRLACLSFGCCYGKPVRACPPLLRRAFTRFHVVFDGPTKKASYASGYENRPLVPIQGITSIVLVTLALIGMELFLRESYGASMIVTLGGTQGWRALSELARADHRGGGRLSAYQWMAIAGAAGTSALALVLHPGATPAPDLGRAFRSLWDPLLLLGVQGLWFAVLAFMGRSDVTTAQVRFDIRRERV